MASSGLLDCIDPEGDCPATQLDVGSSSASEDEGISSSRTASRKIDEPSLAESCEIISSGDERSPHRLQSGGNWLSLLASARSSTATVGHDKKASIRKRGVGNEVIHEEFMPSRTPSASSSSWTVTTSCTNVAANDELRPDSLPKAVESADVQPRKRLNRGNASQRSAIPSYAFLSTSLPNATVPHTAASSHSNGKDVGPEQVEAFVTIAGRPGKGGSITKQISVEEVESAMPVSFIPNLLPSAFADHLCRTFQCEAKRWHTSKRWLYDKEIESHRLESGFRFDRNGLVGNSNKRWESAGFGDDLRHLRQVVASTVHRTRGALRTSWRASKKISIAEDKKMSSHEVAQEVVALASRGQRLGPQTVEWLMRYAHEYKETGWRWEPNYCVANYYADESDFLGAHSDPVESIGPWAVIASLTFGAARQFRMKPVGTMRIRGETPGRVTSYSIRLPHNSLLIMWEGFQEFWRHEVPKDNGLTPHSISGRARLNFTFRKSVVTVAKRRPVCQCGRKAHLKPVLKEQSKHRGRYFWSCSNPRVRKGEYSHCDYFKWDDELVVDEKSCGPPKKMQTAEAVQPNSLPLVAVCGSYQTQSIPSRNEASQMTMPPSRACGGA